jgi:NAD(P)-dependent dehydrogenase (short-subunit alcohol dehydrogenase family)
METTSAESTTSLTALVTGATSGLGFEAAVLLADQGYDPVIVTGRSLARAAEAKNELVKKTGRGVFVALELDLGDSVNVAAAGEELARSGHKIDALVLNAGAVSGNEMVRTDEGIELMMASSLTGHHRFTMDILGRQLLASGARIVIAGSEAARGDVPTFNPLELPKYAIKHFDGDLQAAAASVIRHDGPAKFKPGNAYATVKLFVAWWAASLARQLPEGVTVNAVSPGSAPNTQAARHANFFMKKIMMPMMEAMPKFLGMAAPTSVAASRYVEATTFGADVTGQFFASAPRKMTGPLHKVDLAHVNDRASQDAAWAAIVAATGAEMPALV